MDNAIVHVENLSHSYGDRVALDRVSFDVGRGEIFGFLGPNGSGKTTLFRILSTLLPAPVGAVRIAGIDSAVDRTGVRQMIGVVFQAPSVDKQLTAKENLIHQGHLYGMRGADLEHRTADALAAVGLTDRSHERTSAFSGGMRRRVEVAKGLLHRPRVLLLDEPSTGLDPAARIDLWRHLRQISGKSENPVTILVTTHLMEEADLCTRLAIMAKGAMIASGAPAALKERIGGDVITLTGSDLPALKSALIDRLQVKVEEVGGTLRIERARGHEFVPSLIEAAPGLVDSVSVGKPTLQDVFIQLTGHRLSNDEPSVQ